MFTFAVLTGVNSIQLDEHGIAIAVLLIDAEHEDDCMTDGGQAAIKVRPRVTDAGADVSLEELTRACNEAHIAEKWRSGLKPLRRSINEVLNTKSMLNALRAIDPAGPATPAPPAAEHQTPLKETAMTDMTDKARTRRRGGMTQLIPDPQTFGGMLLCAEDTRAYLGRLSPGAFAELRRQPAFPAPVTLTPRRLAWRVRDLDAFINARQQDSAAHSAPPAAPPTRTYPAPRGRSDREQANGADHIHTAAAGHAEQGA